jgi:hypothetical protein
MKTETPSEALRDSERLLQSATKRSERTQRRCEAQSVRRSIAAPPIPITVESDPQCMTVANWPANDEPTQPNASPFPLEEFEP